MSLATKTKKGWMSSSSPSASATSAVPLTAMMLPYSMWFLVTWTIFLLLYFLRDRQRSFLYLCLITLALVVRVISETHLKQLVLQAPLFFEYVKAVSYFVLPLFVALAWGWGPPPPSQTVTVDLVPPEGRLLTLGPYTANDYSGDVYDPVNLFFLDLDPREIRQALLEPHWEVPQIGVGDIVDVLVKDDV